MRSFTTKVDPEPPGFTLSYQSKMLFMGSCFAEHIGRFLQEHKFQTEVNPFGVVYNPLALARQAELLIGKEEFTEKDLHKHNGLWFSFMHYTLFSNPDPAQCLRQINAAFQRGKETIDKADTLFLTLGTAYAYSLRTTGEIVSNCHKIPAREFKRRLCTIEEIVLALTGMLEKLESRRKLPRVVLTVSPVRHWKDGAVNNNRSKSTLVLAIAELIRQRPELYYFPAYELFMDELRDYRFYADDMLHPSSLGIACTRELFTDTFIAPADMLLLNKIQKVLKSVLHKPRFPGSSSHKRFVTQVLKSLDDLEHQYSFLDFTKERKELTKNV